MDAHIQNLDRERAEIEEWLTRARAAIPEMERVILDAGAEVPAEMLERYASNPAAHLLIEEYRLRLANSDFKAAQREHFTHKSSVRKIRIGPRVGGGGELLYTISLDFHQHAPKDACRQAEAAIATAIEAEYRPGSEVDRILQSVRVRFLFDRRFP